MKTGLEAFMSDDQKQAMGIDDTKAIETDDKLCPDESEILLSTYKEMATKFAKALIAIKDESKPFGKKAKTISLTHRMDTINKEANETLKWGASKIKQIKEMEVDYEEKDE